MGFAASAITRARGDQGFAQTEGEARAEVMMDGKSDERNCRDMDGLGLDGERKERRGEERGDDDWGGV